MAILWFKSLNLALACFGLKSCPKNFAGALCTNRGCDTKTAANVGAVARLRLCTANARFNYCNLFFPDVGQIGVWQMQRQRHIPTPHRNYGRGKLCV